MKIYFKRMVLLLAIGMVAVPGILIRDVEGQVVSGPVSYSTEHNMLDKEVFLNVDSSNLIDSNSGLEYYTEKATDSWGSKEYIFIRSLKEDKVLRKIKFDNSGYFKYPIAISPDSKYLILAERAQSIGEVKLFILNLQSERMTQIKDRVYSPLLQWLSNTEYVYLTTESECSVGRGCEQKKISVKKGDVNSRSKVISTIEKIERSGKLPVINELKIKDSRIYYKDSETNRENNINLEINVNNSL